MNNRLLRACAVLSLIALVSATAFASAYNAHPKLVVVIVVDQFRADMLQRFHDELGPDGFRTFTDRGAYFTDCYYQYANTTTGPGHATLGTGTYTLGHGIMSNEWHEGGKIVTVVEDPKTSVVGVVSKDHGSSPWRLRADTLGDELKLATQGKARVFGVALKDRAAILPVGFSANAAYWIDHASGKWVTSTYYMKELPSWVKQFDDAEAAAKYWNLEWKDDSGKVLRVTSRTKPDGTPADFYDVVGSTPYANDYELAFAEELITKENLGQGPATDLLFVSISSHDILGHKMGPDSPEERAMVLALDKQVGDFLGFLGRQLGLANVWVALTADHGVAPLPSYAASLRLPAVNVDGAAELKKMNSVLGAKLGKPGEYVTDMDGSSIYANKDAFTAVKMSEAEAERLVGETATDVLGIRGYYTKAQLATGLVGTDPISTRFRNAYSPYGWYIVAVMPPFMVGYKTGTTHGVPYSYDMHVPLAFYGLPFQPGQYRTHSEPVDMVATFASLLGINAPTHAVGRVLTEALTHSAVGPASPQSSLPVGNQN
jgi:arylsulfatase A-like enzyme